MTELHAIVEKGILIDLMKAERALSVFNSIAKLSREINKQSKEFTTTYAYLQGLAYNEFILSTSRAFDQKSKRNKTRCIESAIEILKKQKDTLPEVQQKYQLEIHLREYSVPEYFIEQINIQDTSLFPEKIAIYFENELVQIREVLKTLRQKRDKDLAHNEDNKKAILKVAEMDPCLNFGWQFVTIIGWSYLNTVYEHLRRDARSYGYEVQKAIRGYLEKN
jgi:hypothetical protein